MLNRIISHFLQQSIVVFNVFHAIYQVQKIVAFLSLIFVTLIVESRDKRTNYHNLLFLFYFQLYRNALQTANVATVSLAFIFQNICIILR